MRRQPRQSGAAMVLVLIILAAGMTVGLSYLASAAMGTAIATGHEDVTRARYVAESGIDHAICLLRESPDVIEAASGGTLGPFAVAGDDAYTLAVTATGVPGEYEIISRGASGRSNVSVGVVLRRFGGSASVTVLPHGSLFTGGLTMIPSSVRVHGPAHANGDLVVNGRVDEDASATGLVAGFGRVDGDRISGADHYACPPMEPEDYETYLMDGTPGTAAVTSVNYIDHHSAFNSGAHITADNPAGVVIVTPACGTLYIDRNVRFDGTLIVCGNVLLGGANQRFESLTQFPALLVTGDLYVCSLTKTTVEGVVYTGGGVESYFSRPSSELTVRGALIAGGWGFDLFLDGDHDVRYDADLATLVAPDGAGGEGIVEMDLWCE